jgi:hypothetical protein
MPESRYRIRPFEYSDMIGWSFSRYATFLACKRQYYYQYYGRYDLENVVRINVLKNLTNIPLEIGNICHDIIKALLERLQKSPDPIDEQKFFEFAHREGLKIFKTKNFEEVYYNQTDRVDYDEHIFPDVIRAMGNFLFSERLRWIMEEAMAHKDDWIIEPEGYGECRIDNQKVYCKVDFVFPFENEMYVLDWKSGKPDKLKHMTQLIGYATWIHYHFDKPVEQIRTGTAYLLPEYTEHFPDISDLDFPVFAQRIREETDAMYEYCEDPDFNFPKAKEEFKMTESVNFCKFCRYRELCDRAG